MGSGDGWGRGHGGVKMETTVLEQQLKEKESRDTQMLTTQKSGRVNK